MFNTHPTRRHRRPAPPRPRESGGRRVPAPARLGLAARFVCMLGWMVVLATLTVAAPVAAQEQAGDAQNPNFAADAQNLNFDEDVDLRNSPPNEDAQNPNFFEDIDLRGGPPIIPTDDYDWINNPDNYEFVDVPALDDITLGMPFTAPAAGNGMNPIGEVLCNAVGWFTNGTVGAGIATLAVIFIGIGALLGKVSWGMAIMTGVGVSLVFGAEPVVRALSPMVDASCHTPLGMNRVTIPGNPIGQTLCNVVLWFTGPVGAGIASLAVIIVGIGALLGKVSWGMAITAGVGIAIIFGAESVLMSLAPLGDGDLSCTQYLGDDLFGGPF